MFSQDKSARHLEAEVEKVIRGRFPLERKIGKDERQRIYTVDVGDLKFVHPDASYAKQAEAFNEEGTLESTVKATVTVEKDGKPFTTLKNVTLCIVPYPTDRGTYIINGNEKVFLHQMLRRPGIYALPTKFRSGEKTKEEVVGEIRTKRGNYQMIVDKKDGALKATKLRFEYGVKGTATVDGISFLHLLGATDAEIAEACGDDEVGKEIFQTFLKRSRKMSVQDIHEKTHIRPYESDEDTVNHINELLNNQTFDAHSQRINEISTGRKVDHVNKDAFLAALHAMAVEIHPDKENPSLDDPRYKVVLTPEAVIARSVDKGIGEWMQSMQKSLTFNNNQDEKKEKDAFRPAGAITKTVRKTYSSSLSEAIDGGNPLDLHQKLRKVTSLGDFGLTSQSVVNSNRNLLPGMFGKVDPVETPQSGSMGVVEYLARDAEIKDGLIYSKFYRVNNGIADASKTIDDIDPLDEGSEYIAFNDPAIYTKHGQKWELKKGKVRVRHDNQFIEVDAKTVTLIDRSPASHLSYATGAIPFAANNDGARLLMGASMQKQALPVIGAEPPLVQADSGTDGRTAEQELADNVSKNLRSPVDGTVSRINETSVTVRDKDGKDHKLERLNYFSTGKNTGFINHEMTVKVGDAVKKGDLLADGWHSKKGEFSLGKNTMVAYMPYEGLNFEDGVVVSQSFADKMSSEEVKVITIDIGPDMIASGQSLARGGANFTVDGLLKKETKISKDQLAKLDARGIIKKGQEFKAGDVLVARYAETANITDTEQRLRKQAKEGRFEFKPHKATGYQKGKVIDVHVKPSDDGQRVTLRFLAYKPMKYGDKLSGRHGNKGTISKIIPDAEMPRMADGKPVELIFSPLAVPSRKNPGQLFEVNAGMLALKQNKKYVMHSFDKSESERLFKEMEAAGLGNGQFQLYDPRTGKPYENKTTVGPMYIMKLKHKTELKVTRRSTDRTGRTVDFVTNMPKKVSGSVDGERESPQAIGGMEFWSLTSAGAVHNIHEMTTIKSDGIEKTRGRIDLYDAIASGQPIPKPVTPETLKNLQDYLYGAGIRMSPMDGRKETSLDDHFTSLMLSPNKAKDTAFDGLPEVYSSKLDRATSKIDAKDLKQALGKGDDKEGRGRKLDEMSKGGLYDRDIFGEDADKWGKISLATPIANPIFMKDNNAYQALLYTSGIENKDIKRIAKGEAFYVFDPKGVPGVVKGSVLTGKQLDDLMLEHETLIDAKTGGEALENLLQHVDLKKTLSTLQADIGTEKKLDERSKLVNLARVVSHAVEKDYKPTDYLLHTIPVMPLKYRPSIQGKSNSVSHDDLTRLYQHVIEENLSFGQKYAGWVKESGKHDINRDEQKRALVDGTAIPSHVLLESKSDSAKTLYKRVEDLVGTRSAKDSGVQKEGQRKTEDDLKGILDRLASKKGFLREKMQKKSQDFSGRSVIIADPTLDIDDVALPEDMVKKTFEPQILNELRKLGYTNRSEAMKKIDAGDSVYREAVMRVFKHNPVVLNRAPSLHKHSTQGFNVKKVYWNGTQNESNAIGLNAIVTTGFNADFDGDTMSLHVPLSEAAKQEVYDRLMPSKNLINPTNGSMIAELKHEMSLGIFYSTRDRMPVGQNMTFKDFKALEEAYNKGEVTTYQPVTMNVPNIGTVRATCGQHLFNQALAASRVPKQYIDFKKNVNMDSKKVRRLLEQINADKKGGGPMVTTSVINHLRRIGFKTATQSGMSIGLRDFDNIAKVNKQELLSGAKDDKAFQAGLKKSNPGLYQAVYEKPVALHAKQAEAFEQAKSNFVLNAMKGMVDTKGQTNLLGSDNPVSIMMASGARGNAGQIVGMGGMVGVGKDVENKTTMPVHSSLIEGLRPDEFFTMSSDARKGIFDKSIATQDPGALTRQIWFANRQTVIAAEDCGDKTGVELNLHDDLRHLRGRVLLQPVKLGLGSIPVTGKPISFQDFERIGQAVKANKTDQKTVKVRSPLTCKSSHGICQKCYGARADANNDELVPIGEAVGSIAAQALGEPSQQAIMRTFHSGAGQSSTTNAFEQIKNVLELSSTAKPNTAVVAKKAGVITKIDKHPFTGTTIVIGDATYKLGSLAINPQLRVGVHVDACDSLTDPMSTHINPRDVLALRGEKAAQNYLIDTVTDAFKMGNIDDTDRRHLELTVGNMTNRAIVEDPGSTGFMTGQTVRKNVLTLENKKTGVKGGYQASLLESNKMQVVGKTAARDVKSLRGSRMIVKKGEPITDLVFQALKADGRRYVMISDAKPATYTPQLFGVQNDTKMADGNWLGNAAFRNSKSHLLRGAAIGSEDKLGDPLTRQMTGKKGNFSGGYGDWVNEVNEQFAGLF